MVKSSGANRLASLFANGDTVLNSPNIALNFDSKQSAYVMRATRMRLLCFAPLAGWTIFSVGAVASPITYNQFLFLSPVFQLENSTDVRVAPASIEGGYIINGEFCDNGGCSSGAIGTTADSLLRLTDLNPTCSALHCSPVDISSKPKVAAGRQVPRW
jgi:hypothetical protein